jgi:hypothetical protein
MDNYQEIKAKTFKFGAVGDYLKGTLTGVNKTTSPDAYGKLSHIYSVKAEEGTYLGSTKNEKTGKYTQDTEPTVISKGEDYTIFVSNDKGVVISGMSDIKIGQKFMIKFVELKPTTKGNDAKIIKVYSGKNADGTPLMDEEYQKTPAGEYDAM